MAPVTIPVQSESDSEDPIKDATFIALNRVLEPLLELMLDVGITVQEFNKTVRERAVRVATRRVVKEIGRESRSRIAILTGLPRSEITRILNSRDSVTKLKPRQHPARRVLAAWFDSPHFSTITGEPAVLPIFGKKRSFERLVNKYGGGIPVRAMLDELTQMGAVERLADQRVRAKARVPILTGLSRTSIAAIGERGKDLLETLTYNLRESRQPFFEATAIIDDSDLDTVPLIRREIMEQGKSFINSATSLLSRSQKKTNSRTLKSTRNLRLGVTVYYFQEAIPDAESELIYGPENRRKNLQRKQRKEKPNISESRVK